MNILIRIFILGSAFLVPVMVSAQMLPCAVTVCGIAANILGIINTVLVPLLFGIAFLVFLYGVAKSYILAGDNEEERSKGHKLILWGLIGFAVMISVWGLVNVVANTFGLQVIGPPPLPVSPIY